MVDVTNMTYEIPFSGSVQVVSTTTDDAMDTAEVRFGQTEPVDPPQVPNVQLSQVLYMGHLFTAFSASVSLNDCSSIIYFSPRQQLTSRP